MRGVSTASLRMAYEDWWTHLCLNPGEQLKLSQAAVNSFQQWAAFAVQAQQANCQPCIEPAMSAWPA